MQLEHELNALAAEIDWPPTPTLRPQLHPHRRRPRWQLTAALSLVVAALALAVALAVPRSRAAILRYFHLGAATVQLVDRLPAASERPLAANLGPAVTATAARRILHTPPLLPPLSPQPPLHSRDEVVSLLILDHGRPVLLSELYDQDGILLKKLAGAGAQVAPVTVAGQPGLWISGAPHLFAIGGTPPRLAGSVLLWQHGSLTLRLEGHDLNLADAQKLAAALR